jgi:hypothetical protein
MKISRLIAFLFVGASFLALPRQLLAGTTQTVGAGSAVTQVDRAATFDSLTQNGIALSDYTENNLFIGVDGDSRVDFDPFHGVDGANPTFEYPDAGSPGWVTLHATDAKLLYAVEFMYGNGWTTGGGSWQWGNNLAYVEWQTWLGGKLVSSGTVGGSGQILEMGTILGFYDPAGFDQLLVRCRIDTGDPNLQALALDDVNVQLSPPAHWWNYGDGWAGALGVPGLVASNAPVLGGALTITIGNSSPTATIGFLMVGFGETSLPTTAGGTLVVATPWILLPVDLPVGSLDVSGTLSSDGSLAGLEVDLQCIELDPAASRNISFTPGLALLLGS